MAARITFEDGAVLVLTEGATLTCFTRCKIVKIEYICNPNSNQMLSQFEQGKNYTVPSGFNR